ncbi:DEAD/DEAH box helicase [Opitutus sp. GAS368]|uniref:DEAD/DEAH box helicase n=1 Tax=Opitutus sp. GAS368 TaxID=1882749 RepID=UPI00087D29AD|nr:DEAD/DEAH box helicase [Opitutus sp. GAS368]SDR74103.1 Helicase conserved C-terminal domain-containing protein [Opitutus sp. GAS368]
MLRLLLPPNLATAAPRDAIAVRVELDLSAAWPGDRPGQTPAGPPAGTVLPENLAPALAILQRLGVSAQPVSLIQLKRAQLRELVHALTGERVFFRADRPTLPLAWNGLALPGVSEHLTEPVAPPPAPVAKPKPKKKPEPEDDDLTPLTVDGSEHFLAITLPSRESMVYDAALEFLRTHRFVLDPLTRKWWLRDRHKVLNLLATHGALLRDNLHAEFTANFEKNTAHLKAAEIAAQIGEEADGYDVTLGLKAGSAPDAQIRSAVATGRGYIEADGAIYLIDAAKLTGLEAAQRALAGEVSAASAQGRHRIAKARAAEVTDLLESIAPHFSAPETWHRRSAALKNLSVLPPAPVPASFTAVLRPYQQLGVAWLWHLHGQELGGILADEMGLGKTPQALALLAAVVGRRVPSPPKRGAESAPYPPHLVVVPASLVENWRREAARFAPALRVFVHHGGARLAAGEFAGYDLVLTSYGTLARDTELFAGVPFDVILADEAQHLKNRRTQAAQALRVLHGRSRFLLTGTPLENSLDDLRSLFEFLMPGFLPKLPPGMKREERAFHDERLRVQTAPYILRRTKAIVAPELPPKIEQVIWCEPTAAQAALYQHMQEATERELFDLAAQGASEGRLHLATLTQLLRLRQICCDPRLVEQVGRGVPAPPRRGSDFAKATTDKTESAPYRNSAKLEAFRELLAESVDEGHRMLVFSQFTSLLALLREELEAEGVAYCYLDGSMTTRARQTAVDKFQDDETVPVFLISLKAGGTGLNLTGADTVVHYDPWWNPAVEAQATDRTHRIGQTKVVTSYRLICAGTVEEKVMALQDGKRALLAGVFDASDAAAAKLSLADLRALLK